MGLVEELAEVAMEEAEAAVAVEEQVEMLLFFEFAFLAIVNESKEDCLLFSL